MKTKNSFSKLLTIISTFCALMTFLLNLSNMISSIQDSGESESKCIVYAEVAPDQNYSIENNLTENESGSYVFANTIDGKVVLIDKEDINLWQS